MLWSKAAARTLGLFVGISLGVAASFVSTSDAARNSSGTYSLPAGNPVVSGTAISSTVHNNTTSDIATELTDSLSRSGKGPMTAPLELANGTVALPALSFDSDTDCGLYRIGANNMGLAVNGAKVLDIATTGAAVTGTLSSSGLSTLNSLSVTTTAAVTGNATVGGDLDVTGDFTAGTVGAPGANITGQLEANEVYLTPASDPTSTTGHSDTLTSMNIPKAWGVLSGNAGSAAAISNGQGFNVTNVQESGNDITVDFVTDFGQAPACVCTYGSTDVNTICSATTATITISGLNVITDLDANMGATSNQISFVCFGAN